MPTGTGKTETMLATMVSAMQTASCPRPTSPRLRCTADRLAAVAVPIYAQRLSPVSIQPS
jgi:hypothetical protein